MYKIAILLSSYNGNEYIKEQIETIYEQSYKNFELYIRDDGSNEAFRQQLQELQKQYGFQLILGENMGFIGSFMDLLANVEEADLYAFSDQDDIWYKDKLQIAVNWFEKQQESDKKPILYHSAYDVMLSDGKIVDRFYFPNEGYDFRRSITENHYSGFAMVINQKMREMMLKGTPQAIGYHDWWSAMIAHAFGIGYFDREATASHRSHGKNVTTFNMKTRIAWLKKTFMEESELHKRALEFERCFETELSEENKKMLQLFCQKRYSLKAALVKCFYPKRWRPVWSSELVMRFLMLVGKI